MCYGGYAYGSRSESSQDYICRYPLLSILLCVYLIVLILMSYMDILNIYFSYGQVMMENTCSGGHILTLIFILLIPPMSLPPILLNYTSCIYIYLVYEHMVLPVPSVLILHTNPSYTQQQLLHPSYSRFSALSHGSGGVPNVTPSPHIYLHMYGSARVQSWRVLLAHYVHDWSVVLYYMHYLHKTGHAIHRRTSVS